MVEVIGKDSSRELSDAERADTLLAAIEYVLGFDFGGEAMEWLRTWFEGDADAMEELEAYIASRR